MVNYKALYEEEKRKHEIASNCLDLATESIKAVDRNLKQVTSELTELKLKHEKFYK